MLSFRLQGLHPDLVPFPDFPQESLYFDDTPHKNHDFILEGSYSFCIIQNSTDLPLQEMVLGQRYRSDLGHQREATTDAIAEPLLLGISVVATEGIPEEGLQPQRQKHLSEVPLVLTPVLQVILLKKQEYLPRPVESKPQLYFFLV